MNIKTASPKRKGCMGERERERERRGREGEREGGREGEREGGREGDRESERERGREREREREREMGGEGGIERGRKVWLSPDTMQTPTIDGPMYVYYSLCLCDCVGVCKLLNSFSCHVSQPSAKTGSERRAAAELYLAQNERHAPFFLDNNVLRKIRKYLVQKQMADKKAGKLWHVAVRITLGIGDRGP